MDISTKQVNPSDHTSAKLLALNKPKGYLVTRSDDLGRKTVYDLLPSWAYAQGWMPIGRLDLESRGLLLFTTEGKINNALTKPGSCMKVYEIWVRGHVSDAHIAQALQGVETPQGLLKALEVEKIKKSDRLLLTKNPQRSPTRKGCYNP